MGLCGRAYRDSTRISSIVWGVGVFRGQGSFSKAFTDFGLPVLGFERRGSESWVVFEGV